MSKNPLPPEIKSQMWSKRSHPGKTNSEIDAHNNNIVNAYWKSLRGNKPSVRKPIPVASRGRARTRAFNRITRQRNIRNTAKAQKTAATKGVDEYLVALIDPEYACKKRIPVKMPNVTELPTNTLNVVNEFRFKPNSNGFALLSWRPNQFIDNTSAMTMLKNRMDSMAAGSNWSNCIVKGFHICNSELTINTDDEIDGEHLSTKNKFMYNKEITFPTFKYRLVSSKLVITYDGNLDDTSGKIKTCHYIGDLNPLNYISSIDTHKDGSYTYQPADYAPSSDSYFRINHFDECTQMQQFGQFDIMKTMPYYQDFPISHGQGYSLYYYPCDTSNFDFNYPFSQGDMDATEYVPHGHNEAITGLTSTRYTYPAMYIMNQGKTKIHVEYGNSTDTYSHDAYMANFDPNGRLHSLDKPNTTNPAFIIALEGVDRENTRDTKCFTVTIYSNYEILPDLSMYNLASYDLAPEMSANVYQAIMNQAKKDLAINNSKKLQVSDIQNIMKKASNNTGIPLNIIQGLNNKFNYA